MHDLVDAHSASATTRGVLRVAIAKGRRGVGVKCRPQARSRASSPGEAPAGADCQIVSLLVLILSFCQIVSLLVLILSFCQIAASCLGRSLPGRTCQGRC